MAATAAMLLAGCGGNGDEPSAADRRQAVKTAKELYFVAKNYSTLDLSRGPCIGNPIPGIGGDWVADIAHDPRRPVDDEPANQCPLYREGKADHFVELDPAGKLIRTK